MSTHTDLATVSEKSERAPLVKPAGGVVASPRPCPICGTPLTGRQAACSAKCRAAKSRQRRGDELALVEETLTRALVRIRRLRVGGKDRA